MNWCFRRQQRFFLFFIAPQVILHKWFLKLYCGSVYKILGTLRLGTWVISRTSDASCLVWVTSALTLNLRPVAFSLHVAVAPSLLHGPFSTRERSSMNVHVTHSTPPSHIMPVSFNPQEGQNVCWMNQTRCMWLMPCDFFFPLSHGPFEFEKWWKWCYLHFILPVWIHGYWLNAFLLCGPELWGRRREAKQKQILGWVRLKGLTAFRDHDTVKIFCGRSLQDIPPST